MCVRSHWRVCVCMYGRVHVCLYNQVNPNVCVCSSVLHKTILFVFFGFFIRTFYPEGWGLRRDDTGVK